MSRVKYFGVQFLGSFLVSSIYYVIYGFASFLNSYGLLMELPSMVYVAIITFVLTIGLTLAYIMIDITSYYYNSRLAIILSILLSLMGWLIPSLIFVLI